MREYSGIKGVCQRLVLVTRIIRQKILVVYVLRGCVLLEQRNRQQRGEIEIDRFKKFAVIVVKLFAQCVERIGIKSVRACKQIGLLGVLGRNDVYTAFFGVIKVVAVVFVRLNEFQNILLRQGRKQKPELFFVVSVKCAEQNVKLVVCHTGKIKTGFHFFLLNFFRSALYLPFKLLFRHLVRTAGFSAETEIGSRVVDVDQFGIILVPGRRRGNRSM